jgi:hypothetical protein
MAVVVDDAIPGLVAGETRVQQGSRQTSPTDSPAVVYSQLYVRSNQLSWTGSWYHLTTDYCMQ